MQSSTPSIDRIEPVQLQRSPPTTPTEEASKPVISERQAGKMAEGVTGYEMTRVTHPPQVTVQGTPPTAADAETASIESRLAGMVKPKQRNEAHMVNFLNELAKVDLDAPAADKAVRKANEAALKAAIPHFIQSYYQTIAEVEGPQKTAGEILNVHTWQGEFHNWLVTLGGFALQLGVQLTTPPPDPSRPHEVPRPKVPAWLPAGVTLPILLGVLVYNAHQGSTRIQHSLAMQRATRTLTPTRAGGLVDQDGARGAMREQHANARRLSSGSETATLEDLQSGMEGLQTARSNFQTEKSMLEQRNKLYLQENQVKAGKAFLVTGASIGTLFSSDHQIARAIPLVLIAQSFAYVLGGIANYKWAGPARDESLRDGALKTDFKANGVAHARRLADAQGGVIQNVPENDPVWAWGRGIHKNQLQTRLEMLLTRLSEKREEHLHGMSQAMGISDDDLLDFQSLILKRDTIGELSDDEMSKLQALDTRFNDSPQEAAWNKGERTGAYAVHRAAWEGWNADCVKVSTFIQAAARDEPCDIWKEFSSETKTMFNHHLAPNVDANFMKKHGHVWDGTQSKNEFAQMTAEVAAVTLRDPRLIDADLNLKLNRPFANLTLGGSSGALVAGRTINLVKNAGGAALPDWANTLILSSTFALYLNEIFRQGQAVNLTISQKETNKALAPSKYDDFGRKTEFAKQFLRGMFVSSIEGAKGIAGSRELRNVETDIRKLRAQIEAVQTRLQVTDAEQVEEVGDPAEGSDVPSRAQQR